MMVLLMLILSLVVINFYSSVLAGLTVVFMLLMWQSFHYMEWFNYNHSLVMDSGSFILVLLTVWLSILMILASLSVFSASSSGGMYMKMMVLMLFVLFVFFSASNVLMFYVFFEAALIPIFVMILGWGYQPERLQAGVYMMLYTVVASLPLLFSILFLTDSGAVEFILGEGVVFSGAKLIVVISLMVAFLVKLPLYFVHLWLPKAHVEAPVAGSMVLAGVLLKMGGFGVLRMAMFSFKPLLCYSWVFMSWALVGGVYAGVSCMRQVDIKALIAISSVAHMAVVAGAFFVMTSESVNGVYMIMSGHGFCSSGLFCAANMLYQRGGSRSLFVLKGVSNLLPYMTFWWFLLVIANMSAPPSLNLMGELHSIISLMAWSLVVVAPIMMMVFLAAGYSLYMYTATQHGSNMVSCGSWNPVKVLEHLLLGMHWMPINILAVKFSVLQVFI